MKRGDFIWGAVLLLVLSYVVSPWTRELFLEQGRNCPYISGFVKFSILATMGELLAIRIKERRWIRPKGFIWKVIIWGVIGILITLMFTLFSNGVSGCIELGYLPGRGSNILFAFFTASLMNLTFGIVFMALHKVTDTYIELKFVDNITKPTGEQVLDRADWKTFVNFTIIKTIPLFWIPAHTITFLLPSEYRIFVAALLSIALGAILSLSREKKEELSSER